MTNIQNDEADKVLLRESIHKNLKNYEQVLVNEELSVSGAQIEDNGAQLPETTVEPIRAVSVSSEHGLDREADGVEFENNNETSDEGAEGTVSSFFEDDENFLKSDDSVIHEELDMAIIQQSDSIVNWSIENLYKKNGQLRRSQSLKNDPPILSISDSNDQTASFVVTREFAAGLESVMSDVHRGYYGVPSKRAKNMQDDKGSLFERMKQYVEKNKVKSSLLAVIVVVVMVSAFIL